eukprot:1139168-Pelagomonas_calceolata.AAC.3
MARLVVTGIWGLSCVSRSSLPMFVLTKPAPLRRRYSLGRLRACGAGHLIDDSLGKGLTGHQPVNQDTAEVQQTIHFHDSAGIRAKRQFQGQCGGAAQATPLSMPLSFPTSLAPAGHSNSRSVPRVQRQCNRHLSASGQAHITANGNKAGAMTRVC